MKYFLPVCCLMLSVLVLTAGNVTKVYRFSSPSVVKSGNYHKIVFNDTRQAGRAGNPSLPYRAATLLLPQGECVKSVQVQGKNLQRIEGCFRLIPVQYASPYSAATLPAFVKNEAIYTSNQLFPAQMYGNVQTGLLNGYSFGTLLITPLVYEPLSGRLSYYSEITVSIETQPDPQAQWLGNLPRAGKQAMLRVAQLAQNDDMLAAYRQKSPANAYQLLIITPDSLKNEYNELRDYYANWGILSETASTETIYAGTAGIDKAEKIRNYIKNEYQNSSIEYVILGGDTALVPSRGLHCLAHSSNDYEDFHIPSDLYYGALDGDFNNDGDTIWGETEDNTDLLPEIAVGRFPIDNAKQLRNMLSKSLSYQQNPVMGDMNKPLLVGEWLYDPPMTFGADYLRLLINGSTDSGYTTTGIPSAQNDIDSLFDNAGYYWDSPTLTDRINQGSSFIHHVGHSNETYMMRYQDSDITGTTFANLDGVTHSFGLLYTHGCLCGAFDYNDCIAEQSLFRDNFLAAGIFNSRYGWFNQGQVEGPSQHLHREFVNAIYDPAINERHIGDAFAMSKTETAAWVDRTGEFEPGAQRWVHYDNNLLGDPVLRMWINSVETSIKDETPAVLMLMPNPASTQVTICPAGTRNERTRINIYSIDGTLVYTTEDTQGHLLLDVSNWTPGLYIVESVNSDNTSRTRLVVE